MKNLSDIRSTVDDISKAQESARDNYRAALFSLYDECADIQKLLTSRENYTDGEYSIDDNGELCYMVPVPKSVSELPEIGSYLTNDYGFYKSDKTGAFIGQWSGGFISVCEYTRRDYYFVFDHGTMKPIIETRTDGMSEDYVRAKIELYMRERGEFSDVVWTDYYGGYSKHFDLKWPEKGENLDAMTDDELKAIVREHEEQESDDE